LLLSIHSAVQRHCTVLSVIVVENVMGRSGTGGFAERSRAVGTIAQDCHRCDRRRPPSMKHTGRNSGPELTGRIIRLAIKMHGKLGSGLLESVYHQCLCWEPRNDSLPFEREVPLSFVYEDMCIDKGYRADIIVDRTVLLELKSVERILPVHEAQTLTYLRMSGCTTALLMNFNCVLPKDGLRRFVA
jgi:GxxExxY protein